MIKGRKTARSTTVSLHWEEKQKKKELPFLGYFSLVAARRIAAPAISEPGVWKPIDLGRGEGSKDWVFVETVGSSAGSKRSNQETEPKRLKKDGLFRFASPSSFQASQTRSMNKQTDQSTRSAPQGI